jgi:hypothetical protein
VALAGATGDLTRGAVVQGAFGPQFTMAERLAIAETLEGFARLVDTLRESGLFDPSVTAGMTITGRATLDSLTERLRS